jgi:hypothetical protein
MAENQEGVKQETSSESPAQEAPAQISEQEGTAQVDAKSTPSDTSSAEQRVPYGRFQELVHEKNEMKEKLSNMERLLQERQEPKGPTPMELSKKELVDLGIREDAAEKMLGAFRRVSKADAQEVAAPLVQKTAQAEVDNWINDFSKEHEDFKTLEPQMNEVFASLPQQTKFTIASDPKGLELLYAHVKQMNSKQSLDEAYKRGVEDGYKGKAKKSSVTPGLSGKTSPPGELTPETIGKMSLKEYKERRDEILKLVQPGR